jgi:hypothetical protein
LGQRKKNLQKLPSLDGIEELNISPLSQTDPGRVENNFRNATNGVFPWCLPGKDMLSIQPENKNDSINGMTQKGNDLKNLVHSARAQVVGKLAATWPWFFNRAYLKDDIKDDAASNPQDNPWGRGEEHAVKFLSALTGRDCQIDGGYEANNTLVNSFLYKSWRSVRQSAYTISPTSCALVLTRIHPLLAHDCDSSR